MSVFGENDPSQKSSLQQSLLSNEPQLSEPPQYFIGDGHQQPSSQAIPQKIPPDSKTGPFQPVTENPVQEYPQNPNFNVLDKNDPWTSAKKYQLEGTTKKYNIKDRHTTHPHVNVLWLNDPNLNWLFAIVSLASGFFALVFIIISSFGGGFGITNTPWDDAWTYLCFFFGVFGILCCCCSLVCCCTCCYAETTRTRGSGFGIALINKTPGEGERDRFVVRGIKNDYSDQYRLIVEVLQNDISCTMRFHDTHLIVKLMETQKDGVMEAWTLSQMSGGPGHNVNNFLERLRSM